jgi:hypothetical protein
MRPIAVLGLAATAIAAACAAASANAEEAVVKPGLYGSWDTTGDGRPAASLLGAVVGADKGCVTMFWEMSGYQKDYFFSGVGRQTGDRLLIDTTDSCRAVFRVSGAELAFLKDESGPCMVEVGAGAWLDRWKAKRSSASTVPPPNADKRYRGPFWKENFTGLRALCPASDAGSSR